MPDVWLIVEVEDSILDAKPIGDGIQLHYLVSPHQKVMLEEREIDDVLKSAVEQGFEVAYACSTHPGVPPWVWEKVEVAILAALRKRCGVSVRTFDVSITPLNRLVKH
jgi:hypothetical protein